MKQSVIITLFFFAAEMVATSANLRGEMKTATATVS